MDAVTVSLIACVAGNPLKGWLDGEPDDVWEDKVYDFGTLDAAKDYIRSLPEARITHVTILAADDQGEYVLWEQDRDADALDGLVIGRPAPLPVPYDPTRVPDAPPPFEEPA